MPNKAATVKKVIDNPTSIAKDNVVQAKKNSLLFLQKCKFIIKNVSSVQLLVTLLIIASFLIGVLVTKGLRSQTKQHQTPK